LTTEQAATIVMLMQRIGIDVDSSSMLAAQERMGGPGTPHGYLMLSKAQGTRLLEMMTAFLGHLEQEHAPAIVEQEMSA
jgi:hypothetical protein